MDVNSYCKAKCFAIILRYPLLHHMAFLEIANESDRYLVEAALVLALAWPPFMLVLAVLHGRVRGPTPETAPARAPSPARASDLS